MMRRSLLVLMGCMLLVPALLAQSGGQLRFCIRSDPKTFNPLLVQDDMSDTVRYLTAGVLVRLNRQTQKVEPALAASWKISKDGRTITFRLRPNVFFSDGTPFSAEDVAFTVKQLTDPKLHSPVGDSFRAGAEEHKIKILGTHEISITFAATITALESLWDQVGMLSARSSKKEMAVLGSFYVADYKPGSYLLLKRNPNYWRKDASGRSLPLLDSVRIDIQPNHDIEMLRFRRGELNLINSLDSDLYDKLAATEPAVVHDVGPSLDSDQIWLNQVPTAPIPDYKKAWFRSTNFRRAVSEAINRADLARIVFGNHARPAGGPISPANKFWFNARLKPHPYDTRSALQRLQQDGFRLQGDILKDREGHRVEFSLITNAGNKPRERMAILIQDDLAKIGIKVNVVTLDFPSLIERITEKFNYESVLLTQINMSLDPSDQMNIWLSSGENHQWNPRQQTPATQWEAEIDRLMKLQASTLDVKKRKQAFDRVQQIAWEQEPFIYLISRSVMSAISPTVANAQPVIMRPQTYWNADELWIKTGSGGSGK